MDQDTSRDAASVLFDLPGYRVITAEDRDGRSRLVVIEPVEPSARCPDCGFGSARVHSRPLCRVADVPVAGAVEVRVRKRRLWCGNDTCGRATFTQVSEQIGFRAKITTRLAGKVIDELAAEPRSVSAVAAANGVSWRTVMGLVTSTVHLVHDPDAVRVRRLGIDEHRFRSIRFVKLADGQTVKIDPWSIVFTDLDTGAVLDVAAGRRGLTVRAWVRQRPGPWRERVELVAIDMSGEFRAAVRDVLPGASIVADHWHVMTRANHMITQVRRRRAWDLHNRRGRAADPAWKYRRLLTCNPSKLSVAQRRRLLQVLDDDIELAVAWGVKEHVRQLLATTNAADFDRAWAELVTALKASTLPEPASLFRTLSAWKAEIRNFCLTRVTNARTEAANLGMKNIKRAGRGYVNHGNYRARILLTATRNIAA